MRLIPFSGEYLRLEATLPFGVRDASGRLLLPAGARIDGEFRLRALRGQALFADEAESQQWHRRLGAAIGAKLRQNAPLGQIAQVLPEAAARGDAAVEPALGDAWAGLAVALDAALRAAPEGADWVDRLRALAGRTLALARRRTDASLFHLLNLAVEPQARYCAHHALTVALIADEAAGLLGWDEPQRGTLARAALAMNVAIVSVQDALALGASRPTPAQRKAIDGHAALGAAWLAAGGADDPPWCETVRLHHAADDAGSADAPADPAHRLARLLQRVDVFAARISARRSRPPLSPLRAARTSCLGPDGAPDAIGAALLRATGLYPPGTAVELASGERGLVVARGRLANLPRVASLVGASGLALGEPVLRDTVERRHAVRAVLPPGALKVRPDADRLLALARDA
jgi:HD-GYP domain-containing protein (c-di-GMP phosphodiesterase class II)